MDDPKSKPKPKRTWVGFVGGLVAGSLATAGVVTVGWLTIRARPRVLLPGVHAVGVGEKVLLYDDVDPGPWLKDHDLTWRPEGWVSIFPAVSEPDVSAAPSGNEGQFLDLVIRKRGVLEVERDRGIGRASWVISTEGAKGLVSQVVGKEVANGG